MIDWGRVSYFLFMLFAILWSTYWTYHAESKISIIIYMSCFYIQVGSMLVAIYKWSK